MENTIDAVEMMALVSAAKLGDRDALETLIARIQRNIYNLALRMLQHPQDAEDATQEILIRLITHLSTFRGDAAFTTWVYRIASNHLLTLRQRTAENRERSFEELSERLNFSLSLGEASIPEQYEHETLVTEVKINCSLGIIMCLDRPHRIALILGEIFEVSADEAAYILEIPPASYRKQLSRARARVRAFIEGQCGWVNPANPCRCSKHVGNMIQVGILDPAALRATVNLNTIEIKRQAAGYCAEFQDIRHEVNLLRALPDYNAPTDLLDRMKSLIDSTHYRALHDGRYK